ncbi:molybdenum cofactor synthesis 1 [Brevipalpus obovatus]|uniref:molybdenum cofactor synthesis 1 n=1 Tax=Brevipalpus obovatus TaxID=246614 RepID=UPI003D9EFBEA
MISRHSWLVSRYLTTSSSKPLVDTFNRPHNYLRISLTERCNLRCHYCMPSEGVQLTSSDKLLTHQEIIQLATMFVRKLGVNKIKLTGGEPLVRKDCVQIISELASLKQYGLKNLGITTNGIMLQNRINDLLNAGLQSVNISLDTLKPEKFEFITRRKGFHRTWNGILSALENRDRFTAVKINVVVMKDLNADELIDFAEITKDNLIDVRFIEYMPFDGNKWSMKKMFPFHVMLDIFRESYGNDFIKLERDHQSDPSSLYKITGYKGRIGFISSMTNNFCGSCSRLRLTADGNLKVCLFDKNEVSMRDHLRSGESEEDLCEIIASALKKKKKQHPGSELISKSINRPMILIAQRAYSTKIGDGFMKDLSHIDKETGKARMVDVSEKPESLRKAIAMGNIVVGAEVIEKIRENQMKKGDVIGTAHLAGIMGAKMTSSLIPLCHQLPLSNVEVNFRIKSDSIEVTSKVITISRTGVEMEALTSVSIALLTIYDMCKSMGYPMRVGDIHLVEKTKEVISGSQT